jgi:hypothetical protein
LRRGGWGRGRVGRVIRVERERGGMGRACRGG